MNTRLKLAKKLTGEQHTADVVSEDILAFFRRHRIIYINNAKSVADYLLFNMKGLPKAILTMKGKKAPSYPVGNLQTGVLPKNKLAPGAFNACLKKSIFPCQ